MKVIIISKLKSDEYMNTGYVLDGYPPTYDDLCNLSEAGIFPDLVLYFRCTDDVAIERQCKRNNRSTDNFNMAKKRIKVFHENIPGPTTLGQKWFPSCPISIVNANYNVMTIIKYISDLLTNYFNNNLTTSYYIIPLYHEYNFINNNLKFSPILTHLNSTKFHFHIDAKNQQVLKNVLTELFIRDFTTHDQVKIYPISKLHLGPQTKELSVYNNMMNFHEIVDGTNDLEAFVTGRMGNTFNSDMMDNVLQSALHVSKQTGNKIMVELEEYFIDIYTSRNGTSTLQLDKPRSRIVFDNTTYLEKDIPEFELHLGFDVSKEKPMPISLEELTDLCTKEGMNNGGWFIFEDEKVWKYRSNEFISNVSRDDMFYKLREQSIKVIDIMKNKDVDIMVNGSAEIVHGIWTF